MTPQTPEFEFFLKDLAAQIEDAQREGNLIYEKEQEKERRHAEEDRQRHHQAVLASLREVPGHVREARAKGLKVASIMTLPTAMVDGKVFEQSVFPEHLYEVHLRGVALDVYKILRSMGYSVVVDHKCLTSYEMRLVNLS